MPAAVDSNAGVWYNEMVYEKREKEEISRMKRILMLSTVASMQDQFNMANIRMLRKMHCDVYVACNFVQGNNTSPQRVATFRNELTALGVTCHQIDFARSPFHLRQNYVAYRQLQALLKAIPFDCIHCHTPVGGMYGRKAAAMFGIPVIYTAHGFHFYKGAPLWNWLFFYPVEKHYAKKTDVLITINSEDYDRATRKLPAKQVVRIPGIGLKPGKYRFATRSREEVREALDLPLDSILLISVGELNRNKNHRVILQAMARLPQLPLYYILCGKGSEEHFLRDFAQNLHLSDRVRILGYRQDVCDLLHAADIFCFPSKREGLGMAALEAMEAGLPLVTSNIHGIQDYSCSGETGFSCAPSDVEGFAHAIETLSEDRNMRQRMGEYNQQSVEAFYQAETNKIMDAVYREVLGLDTVVEPASRT